MKHPTFKNLAVKFTTAFIFSLAAMTTLAPMPYALARGVNADSPMGRFEKTLEAPKPKLEQFVITLNLRHKFALHRLISEQANPRSSHYRQYLTVSQFTKRFGPSHRSIAKVLAFIKAYNLKVAGISPNHLVIIGEGTMPQIEAAFPDASIVVTENGNIGNTFPMSYKGQVVVPERLKGVVNYVSVFGSNTNKPQLFNDTKVFTKEGGKPEFIYGPKAISTIYHFPNVNDLYAAKAYSGRGETIAIASYNSYDLNDIKAFWKIAQIKHTGTISNVYVNGKPSSGDGSIETTLDLEQASSQAPGANIRMYLGTSSSDANETLVFNRIVTDNAASVVSYSWGSCEPQTDKPNIDIMHEILLEGQAQGIAFFVASGDSGAYMCSVHKKRTLDVSYPASDPIVTAVGGTTLYANKYLQMTHQSAWRGSGGGVSWLFKRPGYQFGFGLPTTDSEKDHTAHRFMCDVSLDANPRTGYFLFFQGQGQIVGGTSAATPNMAALWSLADEAAKARIGDSNQEIYRIARSIYYHRAFSDVIKGNNRGYRRNFMQLINGVTGKRTGYYKAHAGYNMPTGWGSPKGSELVRILAREEELVKARH